MLCSVKDILYIDLTKGYELDFDQKNKIADILSIVSHGQHFYVMANKRQDILGYYLFVVDSEDPEMEDEYLICWTNKCNIRQADLCFLRPENKGDESALLAVSYAVEGLNTYNVFVFDVKTKGILYWFETFHLFESPITGFLLQTRDFMILSKDGC